MRRAVVQLRLMSSPAQCASGRGRTVHPPNCSRGEPPVAERRTSSNARSPLTGVRRRPMPASSRARHWSMRSGSPIPAEKPGSRRTQTGEWVSCRRTSAPGRQPGAFSSKGSGGRVEVMPQRRAGRPVMGTGRVQMTPLSMGEIRHEPGSVPVGGRCHSRPQVDCWAPIAPILTAGDGRRHESVRPPVGGRWTVDGGSTPQPRYRHGLPPPAPPRCAHDGSASCTGCAARGVQPLDFSPWHGTSGRCARLDCAHPPSPAIIGHAEPPAQTLRCPSGRRRVPLGTSLDDGRQPVTPTSR